MHVNYEVYKLASTFFEGVAIAAVLAPEAEITYSSETYLAGTYLY